MRDDLADMLKSPMFIAIANARMSRVGRIPAKKGSITPISPNKTQTLFRIKYDIRKVKQK